MGWGVKGGSLSTTANGPSPFSPAESRAVIDSCFASTTRLQVDEGKKKHLKISVHSLCVGVGVCVQRGYYAGFSLSRLTRSGLCTC